MTPPRSRAEWAMRLRRDAVLAIDAEGAATLDSSRRVLRLGRLGSALAAALNALSGKACTNSELTGIVAAESGSAAMKLQLLLRKLSNGGWLEHTLTVDDVPLATLVPLGHAAVTVGPESLSNPLLAEPVRLSRFAVVRPVGGHLRIESGRSAAAVEILDAGCAPLLSLLAGGTTAVAAADALSGQTPDTITALLAVVNAAGALAPGDPALDPEDQEQRLAQWSTTDLLLHASSRFGRRGDGYGGTYRFFEQFPPLPGQAAQSATPLQLIHLTQPDLAVVAGRDPRLTDVLEARRSLRKHDDTAPITAEQLGELLYRTVRIRRAVPAGGDELVDRPFPAGGSLHELEVYPVVSTCAGLEPGVWHYDGLRHAFEKVQDPTPAMGELVAQARITSLMDADPQVLLIIAARFGRVMWKYESMAYALILKHVGVLYQTLYLTATAMRLAPCAQGGGSADLFAAASGLDYYSEGSVGEFIVGSAAGDAASMWEAAP